jgi:alkaline phosphatase D
VHHPALPYAELTGFLGANRVNGVLFFSGDRHHSEVIRINRPGTYPLHDITVSSLTAGSSDFTPAEKESPYRVFGLVQNNYGRVSIRGKRGERVLSVEFMGTKGEKLGEWSVAETALKTPQ